ncbi:unnamed protein product [Knipowitschia caucasica]|uniref:Uncharacterized protein n=1 Tax=Knipowitschia caucasica TaxID=637954 RepID=A0AAV2KE23_KNICA
MPGKRPPSQFGPISPNKEVNVEKFFKIDEEGTAKPKLTETKRPSISTVTQSQTQEKQSFVIETKPSLPGPTAEGTDLEPEEQSGFEELRAQMKELLLTVELLKAQQMKEMSELRGELDEERHKRMALQMEIEKLKRTVHLT